MKKLLPLVILFLLAVSTSARAQLLIYSWWIEDFTGNWTLDDVKRICICVNNTYPTDQEVRLGVTIGITNATGDDLLYEPLKYEWYKQCNGGTDPSCYVDDYNVSPCDPPDNKAWVFIGTVAANSTLCDCVEYQLRSDVFEAGEVLDVAVAAWRHECPLLLEDFEDGMLDDDMILTVAPPPAACVQKTPGIEVSPFNQSGERGETLTYTFTVKNRDEGECGASDFTFSISCPSGWSCSLSKTGDRLNQGESVDVYAYVTIPSDAAYGQYMIYFTATNLNSSLSATTYAYASVTPPPPVEHAAKIVKLVLDGVPLWSVSGYNYFRSDYWVGQGEVRNLTIVYMNNGTEPSSYLIGLSVAEHVIPGVYISDISCNEECYRTWYEYCDSNGVCHKWVVLHDKIPPGAIKNATVMFHFTSKVFEPYKEYEVGAAIWRFENQTYPFEPVDYYLFDGVTGEHKILVVPFTPPPQGTEIKITRIDVSEENVTFDEYLTVKVHVRNTGLRKLDKIYVGVSLKQNPGTANERVCNRDCYVDRLGDYYVLEDVAPGDELIATRTFWIRKDKFDVGALLVDAAVYVAPYFPPNVSLDQANRTVQLVPPEQKLNACPIKLVAEKKEVGRGEKVSYTAYIENRGVSWNFTLGMSIGIFDAESGVEYSSPQPAILAPCNIECYRDRDKYGEFVYLYIPKGEVGYFTRVFEVPDYFPLNSYFDVVVGVWREPKYNPKTGKLEAEGPICFVYFKNVSVVKERYTLTTATGMTIKSFHEGLVAALMRGFMLSELAARFLLWSLYSVGISLGVGYLGMRMGAEGGSVLSLALLLGCIMFLAGVVAGQIPWWMGFIVILIAGYIFARFMGGFLG